MRGGGADHRDAARRAMRARRAAGCIDSGWHNRHPRILFLVLVAEMLRGIPCLLRSRSAVACRSGRGAHAAWCAPLQTDAAVHETAHDIFKQLIEINTTDSIGSTTVAAQAMAKRLLDAGFPAADVTVARAQRPQGQHGGALSGQSGLQAEARAHHRASRRGGGAARGLDHRSLSVRREGRLLLRPRNPGHEGERCHRGGRVHPHEEGRLRTRPRHHPRAHRGRGGRSIPTASIGCSRIIAISSTRNSR